MKGSVLVRTMREAATEFDRREPYPADSGAGSARRQGTRGA
jgi:hypothetical protein